MFSFGEVVGPAAVELVPDPDSLAASLDVGVRARSRHVVSRGDGHEGCI